MAGASDRTMRFLAGFGDDPHVLAERMAGVRVALCAERLSPAVEIALAMTATLLLRLDEAAPALSITVPKARTVSLPRLSERALPEALAEEHRGFTSVNRFTDERIDSPAVRFVFDGPADGRRVTTSGWACAIDTPLDGTQGNPLAAAFAGVLAATEAMKVAMNVAGVERRRLSPWTGAVSLWDYSLTGLAGDDLPSSIGLDGHALVGCGGVASALGWTLALLPLRGNPLLVDHDVIDETNLNRHLTASVDDVGAGKGRLLARLLDGAGARSDVVERRWQQLSHEEQRSPDVVVVSVDDDPTRRALQLEMPRVILNAGTADTGYYHVTEHNFLDGACLACIARGDEKASGPEEAAARRLGTTIAELRSYLKLSEPLPDSFLTRLPITEHERDVLRGTPGKEIVGAVCGRFRPLPGGPAVSAPMLSAAPGVLLAGELVKQQLGAHTPLHPGANMVGTDILRGPNARWCRQKAKREGCYCSDNTYRNFYRQRWY